MHLNTQAILLSVRAHGEHGAIVRALTPDDGVQAGYVRGGRSRGCGPILQPGNIVLGDWRARTDDALAGADRRTAPQPRRAARANRSPPPRWTG